MEMHDILSRFPVRRAPASTPFLVCSFSGKPFPADSVDPATQVLRDDAGGGKSITCNLSPDYQWVKNEMVPVVCQNCSKVAFWLKPGIYRKPGEVSGYTFGKGHVLHVNICPECLSDDLLVPSRKGKGFEGLIYFVEFLVYDCLTKGLDLKAELGKKDQAVRQFRKETDEWLNDFNKS